jgi:hypothetical protein
MNRSVAFRAWCISSWTLCQILPNPTSWVNIYYQTTIKGKYSNEKQIKVTHTFLQWYSHLLILANTSRYIVFGTGTQKKMLKKLIDTAQGLGTRCSNVHGYLYVPYPRSGPLEPIRPKSGRILLLLIKCTVIIVIGHKGTITHALYIYTHKLQRQLCNHPISGTNNICSKHGVFDNLIFKRCTASKQDICDDQVGHNFGDSSGPSPWQCSTNSSVFYRR